MLGMGSSVLGTGYSLLGTGCSVFIFTRRGFRYQACLRGSRDYLFVSSLSISWIIKDKTHPPNFKSFALLNLPEPEHKTWKCQIRSRRWQELLGALVSELLLRRVTKAWGRSHGGHFFSFFGRSSDHFKRNLN